MPKEASAFWQRTQGVRRPSTLQQDGTGDAKAVQALRMLSAGGSWKDGAARMLDRLWTSNKVDDDQALRMLAAIAGMELPQDVAADPFPEFANALGGMVDDDAQFEQLLATLQSSPETLLDLFGGDADRIADWLAKETVATTEAAARGVQRGR
jgi:hypothetical protein